MSPLSPNERAAPGAPSAAGAGAAPSARPASDNQSRSADSDAQSAAGWYWPLGERPPGAAVVFDVDGVLADASGRQHHLTGLRKDWDAFFEACGGDPLIPEVGRLLEVLDPAIAVILLTARPHSVRATTVDWLERNGLRYDLLVMRVRGDYLRAVEFKQRQTRALIEYGFDLRLALEDDPRNLQMFEREGVPCLYVHSGYYG